MQNKTDKQKKSQLLKKLLEDDMFAFQFFCIFVFPILYLIIFLIIYVANGGAIGGFTLVV